jgi:hypothetical protein
MLNFSGACRAAGVCHRAPGVRSPEAELLLTGVLPTGKCTPGASDTGRNSGPLAGQPAPQTPRPGGPRFHTHGIRRVGKPRPAVPGARRSTGTFGPGGCVFGAPRRAGSGRGGRLRDDPNKELSSELSRRFNVKVGTVHQRHVELGLILARVEPGRKNLTELRNIGDCQLD